MPLGVLLPLGIVVVSANPDLVVAADRYVVSIVVCSHECAAAVFAAIVVCVMAVLLFAPMGGDRALAGTLRKQLDLAG